MRRCRNRCLSTVSYGEKIVFNLLSNAFKYTFAGAITISLRPAPHDAVTLRIADTGIGIPAADLPNIFERFHRVENALGRSMEGSGIGLALVQELAKLHAGRVHVESEYGVGSVFSVTIPLGSAHLPSDRIGQRQRHTTQDIEADFQPFVDEALRWLPAVTGSQGTATLALETAAAQPIGAAATKLDDAAEAAGQRRATVLLADDNADMRDYVKRLLQPHYTVIAVADGHEALAAAVAQTPDLIITDVMMPRLDGFGLLQKLRALPQTATLPVIMLSARAGQQARIEGLQAGADDYLMKPFSARELLARIESALTIAGIRDAAAQRERGLRSEISVILESMDSAFIALDRDFKLTYANAAAERSSGMLRSELIGQNLWLLYPDAIGTDFERQCRYAVTQRSSVFFEYFYPLWGRWYEISIALMPNDKFGMYLHDITAQKSSETALQEMNSQLERRCARAHCRIGGDERALSGDLRPGSVQRADDHQRYIDRRQSYVVAEQRF